MSKSIRLSPKHGVNPAIPLCFYCGEKKNMVILAGKLGPDDRPAPQDCGWDHEPFDRCKKWMERGVILISVRDGEQGDNPYRTGGWVVVTDSLIRKFAKPDMVDNILRQRVCFMPDEVWDHLGLPRDTGKDKAFVGLPAHERH